VARSLGEPATSVALLARAVAVVLVARVPVVGVARVRAAEVVAAAQVAPAIQLVLAAISAPAARLPVATRRGAPPGLAETERWLRVVSGKGWAAVVATHASRSLCQPVSSTALTSAASFPFVRGLERRCDT